MDRATTDPTFEALRQKAEQLLSRDPRDRTDAEARDLLTLMNEVEAQRIELEFQNDELRQANQRLAEARNKLFELSEFAPVAIVNVNAKGLIEHCNEAASQLLSPPPHIPYNSLAGIGFSWVVHPNDRNTYFAHLKGIASQSAAPFCEIRVHGAGDQIRIVCLYARAIRENGQVFQWQLALVDITDARQREEQLKRSEALYRSLANNLPQGAAFIVDHDLKYMLAEGQALHEVGLQSSDLEGKTLHEALDPDLAASYEPHYRLALRGTATRLEQCSHGRDYTTHFAPLRDDSGTVYAALAVSYDITERKRTETALQESEALYRAIAANFPDGAIYVFDRDLRFRVADGQGLGRLGFTREGLEDKTIWEATEPEICEILEERYPRVLAGESLHFETAVKGRVFSSSYVPIRDVQDMVIAGMVVSQDVTERKQAEEKLKESEERFRTMADGVPLIVWVHDAEGNQQFVNQTFLEFFGTTHDEMRGGRWQLLMHPDDAQGYTDEFLACVREQRYFHRQVRVQNADGEWRWIESWGRPRFTSSGKYLGLVGTSADVTERKQAEAVLTQKTELLEGIYFLMPVLLVLWDPHLERFVLNRQAEEVLGYSTAEANEGDFMRRVYPDDAYREAVVTFMQSLDTGWQEWIVTTKDGEQVPIEWANIRLSDDTRIGIGVDLRERKKAEAALRESHQELNEYTYALTHNIKAPFRAVQNYANFLLEDLADNLEGEPRQFLDGIQKAIGLAHQQFVDLEALYQVKDHPMEFEALDMRELIGEIAALHEGMPDRDLVVDTQWPKLMGERFLLRQVLMALVSNGFKYNRSDRKRVEVTWQRPSDGRFEIVVRDNGIGIDPQYHEHIFHIFKRLHTEEEYEGTGIGLSIARRALQRIGGELRIESALGEGSTFVISLPAAMVESAGEHHH